MLYLVTNEWCPNAFIVSFKLETDVSMLPGKSMTALKSYGHQLVIGNILGTHKDEVTLFEPKGEPVHIK
eukprot:CAMPEP_0168535556 /NCGR_PEP_ID=MMETSP0405-20121227/18814_1 /TAXON_ID=498012 /ORGANISM="Trichosphaerium sp, Strain Am-I-7 wt" /LENGTH=68 /DNA_ID=CAMNT_0008562973 /DNA_START=593 /DNA_END=796 /DNA_ORIENTATION=-